MTSEISFFDFWNQFIFTSEISFFDFWNHFIFTSETNLNEFWYQFNITNLNDFWNQFLLLLKSISLTSDISSVDFWNKFNWLLKSVSFVFWNQFPCLLKWSRFFSVMTNNLFHDVPLIMIIFPKCFLHEYINRHINWFYYKWNAC